MIKKGDIIRLEVVDISHEAKPIGKVDGLVIFADKGTFGDVLEVEITKVKKSYALAKTTNIIEASPHRVESPCPHSKECGGCNYMDLSYESQLELKYRQLVDKLVRLGGINNPLVREFVCADVDDRKGYRNKTTYEITTFGNIKRKGGVIENLGPATIGFKGRGSHDVVAVSDCVVQSRAARAAVEATRTFMEEDNITAFDSKWNQGLMRNMVVRVSEDTREVMVNYIINGKSIPNGEKLIGMLDDAIYEAGYELVSVNLSHKKEDDVSLDIYGKEIKEYAGRGFIKDKIGKLDFEVSPRSFYQINKTCTKLLYDKVVEYANLSKEDVVLDLYCGVGSIGLYCADKAKFVLGVESVKDAVINANRNAVINGIVNARFVEGKAEEVLVKLAGGDGEEQLVQSVNFASVVILDPPRAGCHKELLQTVADISPERIVYVSCDAATLSRDIKILGELGYSFVEATPVDMFAFTNHFETVCLLVRD